MSFNYKKIWEIVIASFKDSFKWKIWKWLLTGSIGSLLGILKFGKDFFSWDAEKSVKYGISALVILFLIRFLVHLVINGLKYFHEVYKNSIYGEAIILLNDSFSFAHFYRKKGEHNDTEFMEAMISFCDNLKEIFDKITQSDCSVSIKVPLEDKFVTEKTVFQNLTRDSNHKKIRDTKDYDEQKHTLIGNTAFSNSFNKILLPNKQKYYLNNQVNTTPNYDNTSKPCHDDGILPYNSELVHPIIPLKNDPSNKNIDCHGFICVDSNKEKAFEGKYDAAILQGVADGIYDLISRRNNQK